MAEHRVMSKALLRYCALQIQEDATSHTVKIIDAPSIKIIDGMSSI